MEIAVSEYTNGSSHEIEKTGNPLTHVLPKATGEGLPYAPADFPDPGDVWTWKVGNKIKSGFYTHRFLFVPKRLQKSPSRKIWLGSKKAIIHYLQSEFPDVDIDKFFASFTWEIPAKITRPIRKDRKKPSRRATPLKDIKSSPRVSRRTRSSTKQSIPFDDTTTPMDIQLSEGPSAPDNNLGQTITPNEKDDRIEPDIAVSPIKSLAGQSDLGLLPQDSRSLADYLAEMTQDDFEFYLNSLDDILSDSVPQPPNSDSARPQTDDITKARDDLSSLLSTGFKSLVNSDKLSEITNLSSKLQFDPNLTPEEISILNLVQEIPSASKDFLEAQRVTAQASKFFSELKSKKSGIEKRKHEFILSKGKIALLQGEEAAASSAIREIDEQIAVLQSRKAVLSAVVKTNQKRISDLVSKQKGVFDSIPNIVNEVQVANSERSLWELKKNEAAKQEAEILAKFGPVDGFSFTR
ncbi:hypothetical protein CASFOL_005370 [Castilleja foliolosa]|uniref:DUF7081 domain-containing protein n=1 Tax=Castilleja foliolosa TaxID=1961234 RepID=A0ABD3E587_9LAMI